MAAPTFVGRYLTAFSDDVTPKSTAAFDVASGDVVVFGVADGQFATGENYTFSNSGTALTWTEDTQATAVNLADAFIQTAYASPGGSQTGITGTLTRTTGTAGEFFGGLVVRFSSATVAGTASARSTAPDTASPYTLSITTLNANSAIVYGFVDYAALDHSARVHQTVNGFTPTVGNGQELTYFRDSLQYTTCWAYIPDAGAAGAKTVGMSGAASGDTLLVAREVAGSGAAPALPPIIVLAPRRP